MAEEMRAQRAGAHRPYIVVVDGINREQSGPKAWEFTLELKNYGSGPALAIVGSIEHRAHAEMSGYILGGLPALGAGNRGAMSIGLGSGRRTEGTS
jgi:hypothetical protein